MASNKNSATGLTTGFADLDRVTCGWQPGEEIVIAARLVVGKTAFALHLARTAASAVIILLCIVLKCKVSVWEIAGYWLSLQK